MLNGRPQKKGEMSTKIERGKNSSIREMNDPRNMTEEGKRFPKT